MFGRKSKRNVIAAFSISEEFSRYDITLFISQSILVFQLMHEIVHRIRENWVAKCAAAGCRLPPQVLAEFTKRINAATSADRKTKLSFSRCGITDQQVR
jgi:GTP cyclohydrolase III